MALDVFLIIVSIAKISIALSRGKHNIGFLVILTIIVCITVLALLRKKRTSAGNSALIKMKKKFARLRFKAAELRPGGASDELALLAGIFGLAAIPVESYPYVRELYPRVIKRSFSGACSGSACGGSSCGGSGCGGGGCGGGCGGCGG